MQFQRVHDELVNARQLHVGSPRQLKVFRNDLLALNIYQELSSHVSSIISTNNVHIYVHFEKKGLEKQVLFALVINFLA